MRRFPIFRVTLTQNEENATKTILAACTLHNFLLEEMPPPEKEFEDDNEEEHLSNIAQLLPLSDQLPQPPRGATVGETQRRALAEYYSGDGSVQFQWERALGGSHANVDN